MSMLFGKQKAAEVKSAPMPDPDDKASEDARRRQMAEVTSRSGRAATVLSGGGDYSGTKLGPMAR